MSSKNNSGSAHTKHRPQRPVLFSFFSGIGLLDLAFDHEGYRIALVNEPCLPFLGAYQHSRRNLRLETPIYGFFDNGAEEFISGSKKRQLADLISEQRTDGNLVGFIGGPPCPDFSNAGKNRGRSGINGKLSGTYAHIISQQKPDFFLFENVDGLWEKIVHRRYYNQLKRQLEKNYYLCDRIINTLEYGVPQNRLRVLLIGVKKDLAKDLRLGVEKNKSFSELRFDWRRHARYPPDVGIKFSWPSQEEFAEEIEREEPKGIPLELTVEQWFRTNSVLEHPNSECFFKPQQGLPRFKTVAEGDISGKSFKRLHRWRFSPTASYGNNEVHLHPYKVRRLSVAEALAIQSMPSEFNLPETMSLSSMFKAVGNGVPYLAGCAIAKTIAELLSSG